MLARSDLSSFNVNATLLAQRHITITSDNDELKLQQAAAKTYFRIRIRIRIRIVYFSSQIQSFTFKKNY